MLKQPNFIIERECWQKGFLVLGLDEVGRGALAGPVVAAAVVLYFPPPGSKKSSIIDLVESEECWWQEKGINDSKLLTPKEREKLSALIKKTALGWSFGQGTAGEIDRQGVVWAIQKAMRQAATQLIKQLKTKIDCQPFLLIDGLRIKYLPGIGLKHQRTLIKGDQRSLSIAAASILAKVYRDQLMRQLATKSPFYRRFHWEKNKGYGTQFHRQAIQQWGVSRYHRKTFLTRILFSESKSGD